MMRAQASNQTVGAVARPIQALSAQAAKRGESAACRKIRPLSASAGSRALGALVNPILGNAKSAQYRTGLLVGYLLNQADFDGAFCIQNRKSGPLKLRWCLWGENGERLVPVREVTLDIPPGHEAFIVFSQAAPGQAGVAALWDAEKMDDGVEDQFTGYQMMLRTGVPAGVQQLLKVRDLRGETAATRKQGNHVSLNVGGLDTGLLFINPNHAFEDFPGGTLTGIAAPQCALMPEGGRFYGDDGTEFDLVPRPPAFPLHAWGTALVSVQPPFRGAGGEALAGRVGTVEYVFTGDVEGMYFLIDMAEALGLGVAEMSRAFGT